MPKKQIQPELDELKKTMQRLAIQSTDRYTEMLKNPAKVSSDMSSWAPAWTAKTDQGKFNDISAESQEQSSGHGCRSPPCSRDMKTCKFNDNCCADRMYEMLSDVSDFLKSRSVTHFVVAGTLLGAVRDKDIIPYTSDLDIVIPRDGWKRAKEINYIKGRKRSYYFMQDPTEYHCGRICAVWEGVPVNRDSFKKIFEWDTDTLGADIQYYMDVYDEDMDFAKSLAHLHYPLSSVTIRNHTFPAPHEQDLWVEARYGPKWRTPDHMEHGVDPKMAGGPYRSLSEATKWSKAMLNKRANCHANCSANVNCFANCYANDSQGALEQQSARLVDDKKPDSKDLKSFEVRAKAKMIAVPVQKSLRLAHNKKADSKALQAKAIATVAKTRLISAAAKKRLLKKGRR